MAQCAYCKTQTEMRDGDHVPVCIECDKHYIRSVLVQEFLVAAERGRHGGEGSAEHSEMMKAHSRLGDFLDLGIVPEHLKRSGESEG